MLITNRQSSDLSSYLLFIEECLRGGVTSVQFREKNTADSFRITYLHELKALLDNYNIPLIINDDVELALQVNAHGVHLGQSDGCPHQARKRMGDTKIIGVSIESYADLQHSNESPINYAAASAVFATTTKSNVRTHWGLDGLHYLCRQSAHPIIAIGGINIENTSAVMAGGAAGVAVIAALHDAENPQKAASDFLALINRNQHD